jgi:Tfp pilus assembly protein PilW
MKRQGGFSLINLMVGMVISLIVTVGLLSAFRNTIKVTTQATERTVNDNNLASLLLRTGAAMQDAGYGIATPKFGTHIVPISGASLSGSTLSGAAAAAGVAANGLVWAMLTGATTQCAGFYAPTAGGLTYLGPVTCTDATGWAGFTWPTSTVDGQSSAPITFTVSQQSCAPYGITTTKGTYTVALSTTNSIGSSVSSLQCLINIQS